MQDCIFCKIFKKQIPSDIVFEDDLTFCFKDVNPVANIHFLMVPKIHIESIVSINFKNSHFISKIFENISKIGTEFCPNGFRIVTNNGSDAIQSVLHLHFHILGGQKLGWPPC